MNIYLLRHGEAEPRDHDDAGRQLTHRGKGDLQNVAHQFAERGITLDRCFHSPYVRTTQTAAVLLSQIPRAPVAEALQVLGPEHQAREVIAFLQTLKDEHVLVVGHNPVISEVLALLTHADTSQMHAVATSELNAIHFDAIGLGCGVQQFRLLPHAI
jgi:phosphohistidine phosphatase